MALNVNELILDKVRGMILTDLEDGHIRARLTKIEDPKLSTSADGEEITDAYGALITKLFRAKKGRFEGTNSLHSIDLFAEQFGTEKEVASSTNKITVPCEEILEISSGKITLSNTPKGEIKYIYGLEKGQLAKKYTLTASTASATEFTISGKDITTPTGVTGKIYVEYEYEAESAVRISNNTETFPDAVGVKIFVIFRDQCNENIKYAGAIVSKKGKLDASSVDANLTSTGKHGFAIDFANSYCDDDADLFSILIAE